MRSRQLRYPKAGTTSRSRDLVAVSTSLGSPCTLDPGVNWAAAPMWREGTCFPYGGAPGNTACSATSTFNQGKRICYCVTTTTTAAATASTTTAPIVSLAISYGSSSRASTATGTFPTSGWQLSAPGGTCDDVCGVDLCDKNAMARVNDDATVASVLSSLGKTCSTFLGRSSAGAPFFKGPELCTYYDGASPAGIDCSDTTNPGHEALCYCKTSLIQIEEDEHVADDSSSEEDDFRFPPPKDFNLCQSLLTARRWMPRPSPRSSALKPAAPTQRHAMTFTGLGDVLRPVHLVQPQTGCTGE
ncbi:unnamed protein product [Durusdinium trenchii]|uniref:Uncharacterized protein n=1 Tax=Durusdinium trenchii TaxID=1381693 RepID=A0ABP0I1L1_9DINO